MNNELLNYQGLEHFKEKIDAEIEKKVNDPTQWGGGKNGDILVKTDEGTEWKKPIHIPLESEITLDSGDEYTTIYQEHYKDDNGLLQIKTIKGVELSNEYFYSAFHQGKCFYMKAWSENDGSSSSYKSHFSITADTVDISGNSFTYNGYDVLTNELEYPTAQLWFHSNSQDTSSGAMPVGDNVDFPGAIDKNNGAFLGHHEEVYPNHFYGTAKFEGEKGINVRLNRQTIFFGLKRYGCNTVTDITSIPVDKRMVSASISESSQLDINGTLDAGEELHIIINNTSEEKIIVAIPTTFKSNGLDVLEIEPDMYGEINIISDGTNLYLRAL